MRRTLLQAGLVLGISTTGSAGTLAPNYEPAAAGADASAPAKGENSFTSEQARDRLLRAGFSDPAALAKDADGIWRGTALRGGRQVHVWVDYQGNTGQQ